MPAAYACTPRKGTCPRQNCRWTATRSPEPAPALPVRDYDRAFSEADDNHDGKLSSDEFIKSESIHERQRLGKYVDDSALTTKVKTALLRERGLKSMDVSVESNEGRVLLSGFVEGDAQRQTAMRVARKVGGVKEVKDGMSVK